MLERTGVGEARSKRGERGVCEGGEQLVGAGDEHAEAVLGVEVVSGEPADGVDDRHAQALGVIQHDEGVSAMFLSWAARYAWAASNKSAECRRIGRPSLRLRERRKPATVEGRYEKSMMRKRDWSSSWTNRRTVMLLPTPLGPVTRQMPLTSVHISSACRSSR
jgi:hypothetical protein